MITKAEARERVMREISALPHGLGADGVVVLDECTIERPWGWVFYYQSRRWRELGDENFFLLGSAAYVVNRYDGSIHISGAADPVAEYEGMLADGERPS